MSNKSLPYHIHEPRLLDIINNKTHSCFGLGYFATQTYFQKYSYTCNIDTEICYSCRLLGADLEFKFRATEAGAL